jgi:hypothetical protein
MGKEGQMWRCTLVIPVLGRLRQEKCAFESSLGYIKQLCPKRKKVRKGNTIRRPHDDGSNWTWLE